MAILDKPTAARLELHSMAALDKPLELSNFILKKYDPSKIRPVYTDRERTSLTINKFTEVLMACLNENGKINMFPEITECFNKPSRMEALLMEWAEEHQSRAQGATTISIPQELSHLTLNVDTTVTKNSDKRYFCTTEDELRSDKVSGSYFIEKGGLSAGEAINLARAVVPKYLPRKSLGIHKNIDPTTNEKSDFYNTYVPAAWDLWRRKNPDAWSKLPANCPKDLIQMIKYIIPLKSEREYFYAWAYVSVFSRSYVYLVLNGIAGIGKNRLEILLQALHGKVNSVNGKKETFGANDSKFNGQIFNATFAFFDELHYTSEMEFLMKAFQNDRASKELKGIDATGSSDLYCSMCISNNNPRDNYLPFNARKFSPILLGQVKLKYLMTEAEISEISNKLDESHLDFKVEYVAQIAKWLLRIGPGCADKYSRLEYKGPKFWELAHASMSKWQKICVVALTTKNTRGYFPGWHESKKAFQWTEVEAALRRKKELSDRDYRDPTTVKAFFDSYRDTEGEQVFDTKPFTGSILQDFWVWPIAGVEKISGHVTVELDDGEKIELIEEGYGPPVRPKGLSDFQWRKMKKEKEEKNGGKENGRETDLL